MPACSSSSTVACTDATVSRTDPDFDFAAAQTFAVLDEDRLSGALPDDLPDDTLVSLDAANDAAADELAALGLTEVDPETGDPDLVVFSVAATETQDGVVWTCVPGWVWYGYWGYVWDPCAWLAPVGVDYEVGTVVVGVADPDAQEAVFGGAVQGALVCENAESRVRKGVEKIFRDYPQR